MIVPLAERGTSVRFTYDVNGILQVEVTVKHTGQRHERILQQNQLTLTPNEVASRLAALADLKVHPRDRQENLAVVAHAERLYEERIAERDQLVAMILDFRAVLDTQDERRIAPVRQRFAAALRSIEQS